MIKPAWSEDEAEEALTAMRHVARNVFDRDDDEPHTEAEHRLETAIRKLEQAFRSAGKRPPGLLR